METVNYSLIGREDIAFGLGGTFPVVLADGRTVILRQIDVGAMLVDPLISSGIDEALITATGTTTARTLADRFGAYPDVRDWGVNPGSTDVSAKMQKALNDTTGVLLQPPGIYTFQGPVVMSTACQILPLGSGPGGNVTAGNNGQRGVVWEHDFDGDLLTITGVSGFVNNGVGPSLENILFRQVAGNGTSRRGSCIVVTKAGDLFAPSWIRIRNCTIEIASGKDAWTYGIYLDGSAAATGPGAGGGLRNIWINAVRINADANALGALHATAVANVWIGQSTINGANGHMTFTGPSAPKASAQIHLADTDVNGTLTLDQVSNVTLTGGALATLTTTANASELNLQPTKITNEPTFAAPNSLLWTILATTGFPTIWSTSTAGTAELRSQTLQWRAGTQAIIGTTDNQDVVFKTNGTLAVRIRNDQTLAPLAALVPNLIYATYGTTVTLNILTANRFWVAVTNGTAFTVAVSGTPYNGQEVWVWISNQSGGAMGVITWPATFKMAAWTNPATGFNRSMVLVFDSTSGNYHQIRPDADVAN